MMDKKENMNLLHARLEEAVGLAQAIHLDIVYREALILRDIRPATYIGKGVLDILKAVFLDQEVALVIMDTSLTPVQQRNLEKTWGCKVIDRTALILEIFGERAQTAEGRIQVELAALTFQRSRLVRSWTHLERQRGGLGFIGGPGETQIEVDRRLISQRITRLKKELEQIKRTRELHRKNRRQVPYPVVALVGYTNAGKSTLFNVLTHAGVLAKDILFATLDPTMRRFKLPSGREIILSDTVGFISHLPTPLIAAFRATLEEVLEADLILHVRDIAHPQTEQQAQDVYGVLTDLGVDTVTQEGLIEVWNKMDLLEPSEALSCSWTDLPAKGRDRGIAISALLGEGLPTLLKAIDEKLHPKSRLQTYKLEASQGAALAWLYAHGEVVDRKDQEMTIRLAVRLTPKDVRRFAKKYLTPPHL